MAHTSAVINQRTGQTIASRVVWAHGWLQRLKGLLGTKTLDEQSGMWLKPCQSIHTIGMNYAIDVVFLDRHNKICQLSCQIRPYRACTAPRRTQSALELPAGRIQQLSLQLDDLLQFEPLDTHHAA